MFNVKIDERMRLWQHVEGIPVVIYHDERGLHWCGFDMNVKVMSKSVLNDRRPDGKTVALSLWVAKEKTFYIVDVVTLRGRRMMDSRYSDRIRSFNEEWIDVFSNVNYMYLRIKTVEEIDKSMSESQWNELNNLLIVNDDTDRLFGRYNRPLLWQRNDDITFDFKIKKISDGDSVRMSMISMCGRSEIEFDNIRSFEKEHNLIVEGSVVTFDCEMDVRHVGDSGAIHLRYIWKMLRVSLKTIPDDIRDVRRKINAKRESIDALSIRSKIEDQEQEWDVIM
jgi:hypothetical protein